jgi:hypothetical protein
MREARNGLVLPGLVCEDAEEWRARMRLVGLFEIKRFQPSRNPYHVINPFACDVASDL